MAERQTLKRRGILAAAAAAVAGIAAKQAAQPVLAAYTLQGDFTNSSTTATTINVVSGFAANWVLKVDGSAANDPVNAGTFIDGLRATAGHEGAGVRAVGADTVVLNATLTPTGAGVIANGGNGGPLDGAAGVSATGGASSSPGFGGMGVTATGGNSTTISGSSGNAGHGVSARGGNSTGTGGTGGHGVFAIAGSSTFPTAAISGVNSNTAAGNIGVTGQSNGNGTIGVQGDGNGGNTGTGAIGVQGLGAQYGVIGRVNNAPNTIAVWGNNQSTGSGATGVYGNVAAGYGVYGEAVNGTGVFGQTDTAGNIGVLGSTTAANSIALGGIANTNGSSCFSGGTSNPNAFAAFFQGHVQVTSGAFDVIPLGNKHGLAPHPDGSHRTFYSVESPECWVEDFGKGTLTAGKASITLDADFATLVHTDDYHVFLTAHDADHHLAATTRSGGGFTVAAAVSAEAHASGKKASDASGTFSWRVVAKPKTTANVERLAKAIVGDPKVLIPDASKLPPRPVKTPPSPPSLKS